MPHSGRTKALAARLPLAVLLVCASLAIGVFTYLVQLEHGERQATAVNEAALITNEVRDRLRAHAQLLRSVRGFLMASGEVSAKGWETFSRQLQLERNTNGLQAYGYAQRTEIPTSRLPVRYIAPETAPNQFALNFDLLSERQRAEAVARAVDRDDVMLTGRIELVQERMQSIRQPGLLMVLPVYRPGMPTDTVSGRRAAFSGIVFAAYRVDDFIHSFTYANTGRLALSILDDDSFNAATSTPTRRLTPLYSAAAHGNDNPVIDSHEMEFGQRNWLLEFRHRGPAPSRVMPFLVLAVGLLASALIAALVKSQLTLRQQAEHLAEDMTRELRFTQQRFKLAVEGTNDGIWDRDLVAGTVWHSDRLKSLLGFPDDIDTEDVDFFLSRVHPDDRAPLHEALRRHLADRQPYRIDYRFRKGDGSWAWFQSRGQADWNEHGEAVRLVGSITDISEQRAAEQRLQHYRDFLATVLKFIPHPVFVKNTQREYIAVNSAFCELLHCGEQDLLGRTEPEKIPYSAEGKARISAMDDKVFAGSGEHIEELVLPLVPTPKIVIVRKTLATNPDGEQILIGALTDITELREAERERQLADRQRKAILEAATEVSIIATDVDGTIKWFNRGAEKMLGYLAEEVVDRTTPLSFHLESEISARGATLSRELGYPIAGFDVIVTLSTLYGSETREWTYRRKDGSSLTVNLVVTALREENQAISGYLGIGIDISEQIAARGELERQRARMETIIEHIPGGVSLIDHDLNFIAANQQLKTVLDLPDALFAKGPPTLFDVALFNARRGDYGEGDPYTLAEAIVERARHPQPHSFERTASNGKTIEVRGTPLPDGGFVTIYTDISERKAAEAELRRHRDHLAELVREKTADLQYAKDVAERASAAKSEFLANMTHELRTPMHSILSFANLGGERAAAEKADKLGHYFHRIRQSGDRLLGLLNDLLDLSKFEAGMMKLQPAQTDFAALIADAVAELESWAQERRITVTVLVPAPAPTAFVDATRIGQVLRNLLTNAVKFSPPDTRIEVNCEAGTIAAGRRATDREDVPALVLTVRDQGIGIPPGEEDMIFEKFVQSSQTKTGAGGTGLGLAICREIVAAHRGTIRACNNDIGGGAAFIVTIPQYPPATR